MAKLNRETSSKGGKTAPRKKKRTSQPDKYIENLKKKESAYMPFTEHLEELRKKIIRSVIGVGVSATCSFFFYDMIWQHVMSPLVDLIQQAEKENNTIKIVTSRMQDDFLIQFKVVLMIGVLVAIPYVIFELWGFVLPALEASNKKIGYVILIASIILFVTGMLFARFYIWPLVIKFFLFEWTPPPIPSSDGVLIHAQKYLSIPEYLSFFISFHLAFGICFELPIVSVVLSFMGIIQSHMFFKSWRVAMVIIAIIAANLTPPDWISMIALMLPLICLFFLSAFFIRLLEKGFVTKVKKIR